MPVVKPSLRVAKAALTRRQIATAARELFATRGYSATTLAAIAAEAGVAVQTVYAVYGSKAGILRELRNTIVSNPDADAAYQRALAEPRIERKLDLFAHSIRVRWEAGRDIVVVHQEAARSDLSVRREVERVMSVRRNGIRRLAYDLGGEGDRAYALLDALSLPEIYAELVGVHAWTPDQYESWLASILKRQFR